MSSEVEVSCTGKGEADPLETPAASYITWECGESHACSYGNVIPVFGGLPHDASHRSDNYGSVI